VTSPLRAAAPATLALLVPFQRTLLAEVGLQPDLTRCVACDRPDPPAAGLHFSSHEGGLICRDCESAYYEKRGVTAEVRTALIGAGGTPRALRGAFELLDYHAAHLTGRPTMLGRAYLDLST